jgi:hypothetical protein
MKAYKQRLVVFAHQINRFVARQQKHAILEIKICTSPKVVEPMLYSITQNPIASKLSDGVVNAHVAAVRTCVLNLKADALQQLDQARLSGFGVPNAF